MGDYSSIISADGSWRSCRLGFWQRMADKKLRGCYKPFLDHIRSYYKELFKVLAPLQVNYSAHDAGGIHMVMTQSILRQ